MLFRSGRCNTLLSSALSLSPASLLVVTLESSSWEQAARTLATLASIPVTPSLSARLVLGGSRQLPCRTGPRAGTLSVIGLNFHYQNHA